MFGQSSDCDWSSCVRHFRSCWNSFCLDPFSEMTSRHSSDAALSDSERSLKRARSDFANMPYTLRFLVLVSDAGGIIGKKVCLWCQDMQRESS